MSDTPEVGTDLLTAMLAVQSKAPTLPKDGTNPHFGSKFTTLGAIVEKVGPLLSQNGLIWTTLPGHANGQPVLRYRLSHAESGQFIQDEMPLMLGKNDSQAFGSAITYARRYSLCAVLNLIADEDDDGNAAGETSKRSTGRIGTGHGFASDAQRDLIQKLIAEKKVSLEQIVIMLDQLGADVEVTPGWVGRLSGGRDGAASALITMLKEGALPSVEHPSDIPDAGGDEFKHPEDDGKDTPMEIIA